METFPHLGCIRLWNPLGASDEGTVLAQADSDVAYFTFGDRFSGEHELVVYVKDYSVILVLISF